MMTSRILMFVAALCALAASALAFDDPDPGRTLSRLRACYDAGKTMDAREACMFTISNTCQSEEEGGGSTLGITSCNHFETQAWDVLLNEEYAATMAFMKTMDEDEATYFPEYAKRAEALRDAQRAWIPFRDAECSLDYAIWGSGSMRHIAGTACILRKTAERTITLWDMRERIR